MGFDVSHSDVARSVGVMPQAGCELLAAHEGAFINFLTLATNGSETALKFRVPIVLSAFRTWFGIPPGAAQLELRVDRDA